METVTKIGIVAIAAILLIAIILLRNIFRKKQPLEEVTESRTLIKRY